MPTESATYIDDLTPTTPAASAAITEADDEIRQLKSVLQNTFPNVAGAVTATHTELNLIDGSSAGTVVNSKAVVYGSSGEVNATTLQIGGVSITSSAAELNVLDGIPATLTATELGYVDGVTSAIQAQIDGRVFIPSTWTDISGTASTNATAGVGYYSTSTSAERTLVLPGSPARGDVVWVANTSNQGGVAVSRNGKNINAKADDQTVSGVADCGMFVYSGDATVGWLLTRK